MACCCAIRKLEEISRQLHERDVTIIDLQKIEKHQQEMKQLCESASATQKEVDNFVNKIYEGTIVEQRIRELEIFRVQKGTLHYLCQNIHPEIKGIPCRSSFYLLTFHSISFQVSVKQRLNFKLIMIPPRSTHYALGVETPLR